MTFAHVNVIARVEDVDSQQGLKPVTGEGVSFTEVPYFLGPKDYFFKRRAIRKMLKGFINPNEAYIMRVPSTIADILQLEFLPQECDQYQKQYAFASPPLRIEQAS